MSSDEAFLELRNVGKNYHGAGDGHELRILHDVSLKVARGESLSIVGPSGSGKTTLLNLLGTLDRPDRGQLRLDGRDLAALDEQELARVRNREIGFVFQSHYLLPHLTVLENVLIPTLADGDKVNRSQAPERADRLLRRVGLDQRLD